MPFKENSVAGQIYLFKMYLLYIVEQMIILGHL